MYFLIKSQIITIQQSNDDNNIPKRHIATKIFILLYATNPGL